MTLLARLLDEWRKTFDEDLVDPIIAIGAQVAKTRPPLRAKTQAALEAAWHARLLERDPADLDLLLATKWPKQRDPIVARLHALVVAPADPRIPPKLLELRGHWPTGFDIEISRVLARSPTKQLAMLLDGYRKEWFGGARAALDQVRRRAADPALVAEARGALERRAAPRMAGALAANPGDDATRAVIADELQATGDPRGEFIALQLAIAKRSADGKAEKRAAKLLAANLDAWLRPFPNPVPPACRFERGFPVAITSTARGQGLDAAIDRPEWATVEELTIDGRDADVERLLARLPLLRMLSTRDEVLEKLVAGGPFRGIRALGTPARWFPSNLAAFPDCVVLAGSWAKHGEPAFERYQRSAASLGLQAIIYVHLYWGIVPALQHLAIGPPETRFTVARGTGPGWYVAIKRDKSLARVAWAGGDRSSASFIQTILPELADAKPRELAICADGSAREAVEYCLRNARKRFAGCDVHFGGTMIDLATPVVS